MRPFLLLMGLVLWAACEQPTAFERDNPRDPAGVFFQTAAPDSLTIGVEGNDPVLQWVDNVDTEEGYLVEKALTPDRTFEALAVLPEDSRQYRDTSSVGPDTRYRVSAFITIDGERRRFLARAATVSVGAGEPYEMLRCDPLEQVGDSLRVVWQDHLFYEDGFIISRHDRSANAWKELGRTGPNASIFMLRPEEVRYDGDGGHYNCSVDLDCSDDGGYQVAGYAAIEEDPVILATCGVPYSDTWVYTPDPVSATIVDEETIALTWRDDLSFETGFVLRRWCWDNRWQEEACDEWQVELPPGQEQYTDHLLLQEDVTYVYCIAALDEYGESVCKYFPEVTFTISPPTLSLANGDPSQAQLVWTKVAQATGYVLRRCGSRYDSCTDVELDPETRSFIDTQVDMRETDFYEYNVRTKSSAYSNVVYVYYDPAAEGWIGHVP